MPKPKLVQDDEIEAALTAIDDAPALGPEVGNLLRNRIRALSTQVAGLSEELEQAERRLAEIQLQDAINFSTLGR
jgi:hypothetical protein